MDFPTRKKLLSSKIRKLFRRPVTVDFRLIEGGAPGVHATTEELEIAASQFPSMGGTEIGPFLRDLVRKAPANTAIVEVGSWLGAGTAQLALGVRDRGVEQTLEIFTYDRWIALDAEVEKVRKKTGASIFQVGEDTLPWVMNALRPFNVPIKFVKGDIAAVTWNGMPISVYVDDAAKSASRFFHMLRTFGNYWIPGTTVLVLMDYHYWKKTGSDDHKCQTYFIESHPENFAPVEGFKRGSNAAFAYTKRLEFDKLSYNSLLQPGGDAAKL
jgi:hypothetical protein